MRAGMPSSRTSTAIAVAYCWQKPAFVCVRNARSASASVVDVDVGAVAEPVGVEMPLDREDLVVVRGRAGRPILRDLADLRIEHVVTREIGPVSVLQGGEVDDLIELLGRRHDDAGGDPVLEPRVEPVHECLAPARVPRHVAEVPGGDRLRRLRHRERVGGTEVVGEDPERERSRPGVRRGGVSRRLRQDRRDRHGLAAHRSVRVAAPPLLTVELVERRQPPVLRVGGLDLEQVADRPARRAARGSR